MFISVKLGDASSMMINLDGVATVKWGNPTIVSLVLG